MRTRIALFRGINVGGRHKLPMKELRALLERLGADSVRTYIQSGNVVFRGGEGDTETLGQAIGGAVEREFGFKPQVLVMTPERLERAMSANPFPEAEAEPKSLHVFFLATEPDAPEFDKLDALATGNERYVLHDTHFYLHTPDGFGRSKLASVAETAMGVPATARNWRTVRKLRDMIGELED